MGTIVAPGWSHRWMTEGFQDFSVLAGLCRLAELFVDEFRHRNEMAGVGLQKLLDPRAALERDALQFEGFSGTNQQIGRAKLQQRLGGLLLADIETPGHFADRP